MGPGLRLLLVSLVIAGILIPLSAEPMFLPSAVADHQMAKFHSYDELITFMKTPPTLCYSGTGTVIRIPGAFQGNPPAPDTIALATSTGSTGYSTTNVQVQGVDELDTVKTDGLYIYTITNNTLVIVKANPSDASVVSKISLNATLTGVFVYGNSLVLIGGPNGPFPDYSMYGPGIAAYPSGSRFVSPYWYLPSTSLWVYDISNISSPSLSFSLRENGTYVGSRLISSSVYLITTDYARVQNDSVILPSRVINGQVETTQPGEI